MHQKSLVELAADLKKGVYSSEELTRASLQRIRQYDKRLNSFITVTEAQALAAAQATGDPYAQSRARALLARVLKAGAGRP